MNQTGELHGVPTLKDTESPNAVRVRSPKRQALIDRIVVTCVQGLVIIVILALWELAAEHNWINGRLFGSPKGILEALDRTWRDRSLQLDTELTFYETALGFIGATVIGTGAGLSLWFTRFWARVIEPLAVAFNGVPKIALAPLIIIWIGAGLTSKIVLALVSALVVSFLAAYAATQEVDPDLITLLRSFGARRSQIFTKLLIPSAMPLIFATMRINVGFALVGAVAGEFISSAHGLGHTIFVAGNLFDLNTVWLGIIALSIIAGVMYATLGAIEHFIVKGRS